MLHHNLTHTVFLGSMLILFAGFARADIVQCVEKKGTVIYTDVLCQNGTDVARPSALTQPAAIKAKVSSPARTFSATAFSAAAKDREAERIKKPASNRRLSLDAVTMKAARSSMLSMDEASYLLRQEKMAALDERERARRWYSF